MTTTTKRQRRAQQLAELVAQQEALAAEEKAEETAIEEAMRRAGRARCAAVEELYEMFDIEEEITEQTVKGGGMRRVRKDRDEARRAALLVEAVVAVVAERDELREDARRVQDASPAHLADTSGENDEPVDPHVRGWSPSS